MDTQTLSARILMIVQKLLKARIGGAMPPAGPCPFPYAYGEGKGEERRVGEEGREGIKRRRDERERGDFSPKQFSKVGTCGITKLASCQFLVTR